MVKRIALALLVIFTGCMNDEKTKIPTPPHLKFPVKHLQTFGPKGHEVNLFKAEACTDCESDRSLIFHSPSSGALHAENPPGTHTRAGTPVDTRIFYGNCRGVDPSLIVYEKLREVGSESESLKQLSLDMDEWNTLNPSLLNKLTQESECKELNTP